MGNPILLLITTIGTSIIESSSLHYIPFLITIGTSINYPCVNWL
jgi:hypothetical protein